MSLNTSKPVEQARPRAERIELDLTDFPRSALFPAAPMESSDCRPAREVPPEIRTRVNIALRQLCESPSRSDRAVTTLERVVELRLAGQSYEQIAADLGCTRANVHARLKPLRAKLDEAAAAFLSDLGDYDPEARAREHQVLDGIRIGLSQLEIARRLQIGVHTVADTMHSLRTGPQSKILETALADGLAVRQELRAERMFEFAEVFLDLRLTEKLSLGQIGKVLALHPPDIMRLMAQIEKFWGFDAAQMAFIRRRRYAIPPSPPRHDPAMRMARCKQVLELLAQGVDAGQIARRLRLPSRTVTRDISFIREQALAVISIETGIKELKSPE